jgi:uncharacterized protein YukE
MPGFSTGYCRTAPASPPPEGDPSAVAAAARTFQGAADAMDRSARDLAQALVTLTEGPGSWQGEASLQFAELSNALHANTQQFATNFRELAGALNSLASGLEYAQEKRREAEIGAAVAGLLLIGAIIQLGLDPVDDAATAAAVAGTTALTAEATAAAAEATSVALAVLRALATALSAIRGLAAFVLASHVGAGISAGGQTAMISWLASGKIDWNEIGPSVLFGTVTGLPVGKVGGALLRALRREGIPEAEAQILVRQEVQSLSSGEWRQVKEYMSDTSRTYQNVAGGRDGMAFVLSRPNGKLVKFDGYDPATNTLIETKGDFSTFRNSAGEFKKVFETRVLRKMERQAERQLDAAGGTPIEWRFMDKEAADYVKLAFARDRIPIKVVYYQP